MSTSASTAATQPGDSRVARAIDFLVANAAEQPDLATLAGAAGVSEAHFQRLFRHEAGVSPKRFLQYLAACRASRALEDGATVLDAALGAGLSGPGRLHDLTVHLHAMTPGEVRAGGAGLALRYGVHDTPLGPLAVAVTGRGLCELAFAEAGSAGEAAFADALAARWPGADRRHDPVTTGSVAAAVTAPRGPGPLSLHVRGTNFQLRVWEALLRIPPGGVTTYAALADAVGAPGAARAVGTAVGANPAALVIPCHRVIRASGALGGYRWGLTRKRLLLACEAAQVRATA